MHALSILFLAPLLTVISSYPTKDAELEFALEAETGSRLVPRQGDNSGSSYENAIDMDMNCFQTEDTCDADAFAMLCLGAPRTFHRNSNPSNKRKHYTSSGAKDKPFQTQNLAKYGVSRPNSLAISAEEFPFKSADVQDESTRVAFVFPVSKAAQDKQAGNLITAYSNFHVLNGKWFYIRSFTNCNRPYCTAFNANDPSACQKKVPAGIIDYNTYAYRKTSKKHSAIKFSWVGLTKTSKRSEEDRSETNEDDQE